MSNLKLSKNLMQMKFMKRAKDEIDKEDNDGTNLFNKHNYLTKQQKYLFEPSYTYFENTKFGRVSFKGMNQEIEKIMNDNKDNNLNNKPIKIDIDDDVEITDKEMAEMYLNNRNQGISNKRKREN